MSCQQEDTKFITVRSIDTKGELGTSIVAAVQPDSDASGAEELMEALLTGLKRPQEEPVSAENDPLKRLVGLATDGDW